MNLKLAAAFALVALFAPGCGRKADPQPYEVVRPERIQSLSGRIVEGGVRLSWIRPSDYDGGRRMDDLGGFLVFRGRPGETAAQIGEVAVSDNERFQRQKEFEYTDAEVDTGKTYYYRIVAYTTDRYYSEPSNQITVELTTP